MSAVTFDVTYTERRSRLTTFFRYLLAFPHLLVATVWGYAAQIVALLQWFVIVFTGERNAGLWRFQRGYLAYNARVSGYVGLLFDAWPAFGAGWGDEPVAFGFEQPVGASRLTNALRFLWIIPAMIVGFFLGIAVAVVAVVSWLAIVITGRHPRGMFDFMVRVTRFNIDLNAYSLLMTDSYPTYDGSHPTGVLPPGDRPSTSVMFPTSARPASDSGGEPLPPPSGPPVG